MPGHSLSDGRAALRAESLTVGYKRRGVVTDINATLPAGRLTCLVGPNGAGKSTLLRTLSAFLRPVAGHVTVYTGDDDGGRHLDTLTAAEVARLISIVLTEPTDLRNMTVAETVALGRSPYTDFLGRMTDDDRRVTDESIADVGLTMLRDRRIGSLSDGERQKVFIAKALAQQTPVIMLDEPTAFLDYPSRVMTMQLLSRLAHDEGKAILLSTHDMEQATLYADMFWVVLNGTLTVGRPDSFDDRFYDHWVVT